MDEIFQQEAGAEAVGFRLSVVVEVGEVVGAAEGEQEVRLGNKAGANEPGAAAGKVERGEVDVGGAVRRRRGDQRPGGEAATGRWGAEGDLQERGAEDQGAVVPAHGDLSGRVGQLDHGNSKPGFRALIVKNLCRLWRACLCWSTERHSRRWGKPMAVAHFEPAKRIAFRLVVTVLREMAGGCLEHAFWTAGAE